MHDEGWPRAASEVALPPDLLELTELLAEAAHDAWSRRRMAEGWRYGPRRDDERKLSPDLVPYDQLPDSLKEYDRQTALAAIRAVVALGYHIERP